MKNKLFLDQNINEFIENNLGIIINTISKITGRYVSIENDEEFSIGLCAFLEALERYDESKGDFICFAKLVIESRIKNYLKKENKHKNTVSIDLYNDMGVDVTNLISNPIEDKTELLIEIDRFKKELNLFSLTLEDLANSSPKHKDTKENAIKISEKASEDSEVTDFMYEKRRLPIRNMSLKYLVSEKVLKRSKKFIISLIIIFFKKYRNLILWIKG
ncbi:sigma factor [Eubacterium multiforme]|uniref:RNA polymerase sigma factor SigI n=1 Tax=Eubacterium multiforme TaxID=83339 RepID=A0ABT9UXW0_9FIRM|nr:sigma factor [Eubacterium multiforme]MDQ0151153.1 RNA polymerase sigma factor [Eubacterium multiforme]